jgi:hypothetical protein
MIRSELVIIVILRFIGGAALFAIPAIFLPFSWMDQIHGYLGLGTLPAAPIVSYLARSLSAFYAATGAFLLFISTDVRRFRSLVAFWGVVFAAMGCVLLGIDISAGMPTGWTVSEGPPAIVVGLVVVWLARQIRSLD